MAAKEFANVAPPQHISLIFFNQPEPELPILRLTCFYHSRSKALK